MKDAQSAAGFGGHLGDMICPRKIKADVEAQNFE